MQHAVNPKIYILIKEALLCREVCVFMCEATESDVVLEAQSGAWQFCSRCQCFYVWLQCVHPSGSFFPAGGNGAVQLYLLIA